MIAANVLTAGEWSQFGLAGLVIAALFTVLWLSIKAAVNKFDEISSRQEKTIETFRNEHSSEREHWRQEALSERATWRDEHAVDRESWKMSIDEHGKELKVVVTSLVEAVKALTAKDKRIES